MIETREHPATFTPAVLESAQPYLDAAAVRLCATDEPLRIFDPFAGTGGIHALHDDNGDETWGAELEPEWAAHRPDRTLVADALRPPFRRRSFHVVMTSPCYGNRFADKYDGRDGSKRYTYRISLGRMPTDGSAAIMQWGDEYRRFHRDWLEVALDMLVDDGDLLVNISNHLRTLETGKPSVEMHVVEWFQLTMAQLGFRTVAVVPVGTPRNKNGANADVRSESEFLIVGRRPPGRELREAAATLSAPLQSALF